MATRGQKCGIESSVDRLAEYANMKNDRDEGCGEDRSSIHFSDDWFVLRQEPIVRVKKFIPEAKLELLLPGYFLSQSLQHGCAPSRARGRSELVAHDADRILILAWVQVVDIVGTEGLQIFLLDKVLHLFVVKLGDLSESLFNAGLALGLPRKRFEHDSVTILVHDRLKSIE
jgi:hypothetical protein